MSGSTGAVNRACDRTPRFAKTQQRLCQFAVAIGIGGGGNFLVGGPANAYALQPISLQGQTGLNVTAGIAGLELQPFYGNGGPRRHARRHHRRG